VSGHLTVIGQSRPPLEGADSHQAWVRVPRPPVTRRRAAPPGPSAAARLPLASGPDRRGARRPAIAGTYSSPSTETRPRVLVPEASTLHPLSAVRLSAIWRATYPSRGFSKQPAGWVGRGRSRRATPDALNRSPVGRGSRRPGSSSCGRSRRAGAS
jgi:hypothetical protein